ncbi:MAG: GDYXXLXY domain-containing protein [Hyphomonadaceae bacterium]|jgi:uncharacterized membrane-anchored protein|nr:GDYXXLXY domain-containing protein [Hyphomonadaceae bacterium]
MSMTTLRKLIIALAAVALAQTGVLAAMVIDRTLLLKNGREITLPIVPVDPRDLFRGEYVRLGYEINTVPGALLVGPPPAHNAAFYVTLEKNPQGGWTPVKVSAALPHEPNPNRIVLKGRSRFLTSMQVRYGIESYFVPEGQGKRLEELARERKMAARVAVDARGNAAIKGLIIDGVLQYEEPLF